MGINMYKGDILYIRQWFILSGLEKRKINSEGFIDLHTEIIIILTGNIKHQSLLNLFI